MTAPAYSTDLTDMTDAESGTWGEITSANQGGTPAVNDTDYFIQGQGCVTQSPSNKTGLNVSMYFDYGSDLSSGWSSGDCFFFWQVLLAGNAMDTFANGGMRLGFGSSASDFEMFAVGGNDFGRNPYGGWQNIALDPEYNSGTGDYTIGTPTGAYRYFASQPNLLNAISKGNLHAMDAIRYGRGQLLSEYGETADYATFAGMAAANDLNTSGNYNRWGLFQAIAGGYLWKGLMSLGETNPVDFRDANAVITIDDCPKTYAAFNKIEIKNSSSRVDWTNVFVSALGTLAPGVFEVVDNADVNFDGCNFANMGAFTFQSNSSILNCIFRGCGQITAGGAEMLGSNVSGYEGTSDTSALIWNVATDPDGYLDDMTFTKGTASTHAIEFGLSSPTTINLRGIAFSGYNASDGQTDSTLHIKRTSGTVTIYANECSGNISYKSDGATVNIVLDTVTVKVTVKDAETLAVVQGCRVLVWADSGGDLPSGASVSITRSGTTATVSHSAHGFETGQKVWITGANEQQYNGVFSITVIDAGSYSYTVDDSPDTPATGTITATAVILDGTSDASGIIQDTGFEYTDDQPILGRVRKGTATPLYKTSIIQGDILSGGFSTTVFMVSDE